MNNLLVLYNFTLIPTRLLYVPINYEQSTLIFFTRHKQTKMLPIVTGCLCLNWLKIYWSKMYNT